MAAINDLISQIADVELRERIQREVDKMNKQKKFGLVFEEHLPECTPLYDMPVKRGCNVVLRNNKEDKSVYVVLYIDGENAVCVRKNDKDAEKVSFALSDIVRVAEFGEPIYPKSLYSVRDTLEFFVKDKHNALVVDFFAGSGTTLHAVTLLNAEDGGHRRCILVTNNEVSDAESKELSAKGFMPGDEEWEKLGIARYVTWPRTVCSIEGHDANGIPLKGNYLGSDIPMADGFRANAAFFKLGFLDKTAVALGMRFKEMLSTLWMKAGAIGKCPEAEGESVPDFLILPQNRFGVLINENAFASFAEQLAGKPEIQTVFINTDYEVNYRAMAKELNVATTYQLYRDYLDHFRINHGRN